MSNPLRSSATNGASFTAFCVLAALFALAGPIVVLAPRGMAPLFLAAALVAMASERVSTGSWPGVPGRSVLYTFAFLTWCALTLLWDLNAPEGARKLVDIIAVCAATLGLIGVTGRLSDRQRQTLATTLVGGALTGFALLGIETGFGFPLHRLVEGATNPKFDDLLESKRSVDAIPLIVWPSAVALARLGRRWFGLLLAVIFALASLKLITASATLAMLVSLVIFALALWRISVAFWLLSLGTVAAFVIVIPLSIAVYDAGGTTTPVFAPLGDQHQISARHRLEIWHFAAEKALDRPLFGHGINSSRFIPNGGVISAFQPDPTKPIIPLHPHNGFLQVWLELGLVGAVFVCALLLAGLRAIRLWPKSSAQAAFAGYAAALVIAGLSFGLWQTWWMATLAFSAIASFSLVGRARYE